MKFWKLALVFLVLTNTLSLTLIPMTVVGQQGQAKIFIEPSHLKAVPIKSYMLNLTVMNVTDLYAWEVKVYYNRSLITIEAVEGPFLKSVGNTAWMEVSKTDHIHIACALIGEIPGANGAGVIASLKLWTWMEGNSTIDLKDVILLNSQGEEIECQVEGGLVEVARRPDIDVVEVEPYKRIVGLDSA